MRKTIKIAIGSALLILFAMPCVLILNENMECWPINLLGLLYCWWFGRNVKRLFEKHPQRRECQAEVE